MGSRITYVTCRQFQPKSVYFRALHHVSHQEAIGILDPFQRNEAYSLSYSAYLVTLVQASDKAAE